MTLRAIKPEIVKPEKPKLLLSGRSGVGKTLFALEWPKPYLIDTEGGATREQYRKKLMAVGGAYFGKEQGSQDFSTVIDEIKTLATTKHEFKTLIIDSFSHLYNTAASIAEEKVGNDFGRDKKEANRPTRQLMRWLETIDMNVVMICHQREKWERRGKDIINTGSSFDGYEKLEYILDLWLELQRVGQARILVVKKTRIEAFPEAKELEADIRLFSELYGKNILERSATPVVLVNIEQVQLIKNLVGALNIAKDEVEKWLETAKVDKLEELDAEHGLKIISFLQKKIGAVIPDSNVPKNDRPKEPVAAGRK